MIKHIVFGMGNVLMTFIPEVCFIRWFQSEEKTYRACNCIFTHKAWEKYDQGIWMPEDLYTVYHNTYPDMVEETDIVLQGWLQLMQLMQESIAFMKQMKNAGYGTYILSNISQDSADYSKETQQFFPLTDDAALSYEERASKPDPYTFEVLLEHYEPNTEGLLYLGDNVESARQAEKMGIQEILSTDEGYIARAQKLLKGEYHVEG